MIVANEGERLGGRLARIRPGDEEAVDVHDPQQLGAARLQLGVQARQGQVEHRQIHGVEQAGQGDHRQAEPFPASSPGLPIVVLTHLPPEGKEYRHLTRPQHTTLFDSNGRLIVDYLIRFESLQKDFDQVCQIIGKPQRKLPHVNKGNRKPYSDYFDEECRRLFMNQFGRDVDLFGYQY